MKAIKLIISCVILTLAIMNSTLAAHEKSKLIIAGDYWCPYNCMPDSKMPGFFIDVVRRALHIYAVDIEYVMMPWSQALDELETGKIDGIIGISNLDGKNAVASKLPLDYSLSKAYTRSDQDWVYDGIGSLKGKRLCFIMGYTVDEDINNYIGINYTLDLGSFVVEDGKNAVIDSIANILDNKCDVYVEDEKVVKDYLYTHGLTKFIKDAGAISNKKIPLYIAFSKSLPNVQKYITYFEDGLASLKATGEYDSLRLRYKMD